MACAMSAFKKPAEKSRPQKALSPHVPRELCTTTLLPPELTLDEAKAAYRAAIDPGARDSEELLPRRTLLALDMAANTLENEASYAKEPARVTAMVNAIRMTLGLILLGKVCKTPSTRAAEVARGS